MNALPHVILSEAKDLDLAPLNLGIVRQQVADNSISTSALRDFAQDDTKSEV